MDSRFPVPDGPHNDAWKPLLRFAIAVWDDIAAKRGAVHPIRIGGGSMLLRRYRHRKSRDLDLFVTDLRMVRWASPLSNDAAADLFADHEEEATAVKLITGLQEVDVIAAAPVFETDAVDPAVFFGRTVEIERPREILGKKFLYRGTRLQPRDVFDFAAVAAAEPDEVAALKGVLPTRQVMAIHDRLGELADTFEAQITEKVEPYPDFVSLSASCLDLTRTILGGWISAPNPP